MEESKESKADQAQAGDIICAKKALEANSGKDANVRAVLDFSRALETAKNVMQLKQDWEQRKAYLE